MTAPSDDDDAALAEQLLLAQRRVVGLDLEPADKQRVFQRLLAITDAAKHDTARAASRLAKLLDDLDHGRTVAGDDPRSAAT